MVRDRVTDGRRIAQLLASELRGRPGEPFDRLAVANACDVDPDDPAAPERAYDVTLDGEAFAAVYVHPDRAHVELDRGREGAVRAARERDLRVRPTASDPPRVLLFVESGAEVKRAADALGAAAAE